MPPTRRYNPTVALVLAIFLGFLGIDRFYTGNVGMGLIKLVTLGGFGFWWIIDIVLFAVEALSSPSTQTPPVAAPVPLQAQYTGPVAQHTPRPSPERENEAPVHVPPPPRGEGLDPWSRPPALTEVVGEYYRRAEYEAIFAGLPKDGTFSNLDRIAAIYPDPENPYSSGNAVTVWIDGHHAGFLAEGNSSRYAPLLKQLAEQGRYLTMRARLTGRFDTRQKRWRAEAGLELPEPELILPVNGLPGAGSVLIPAGRSIQVTEEARHMDVLGPLTGDGSVLYAATLHAIHEVRPRSSFETVEVRINGDAVGVLSKTTAEKVLPLVQLIERRGLDAVARATVTGNSLSAEVKLSMIRSSEADPAWIQQIETIPLTPRSAEGTDDDGGWSG